MIGKLSLRCLEWRPISKNSLRGFATIQIAEMHMLVHEVAIHTRAGKSWAQPPSRPWVKDGHVVRDAVGKIGYSPIIEFTSPKVRAAWSAAVIKAVLEYDESALGEAVA